MIFSFARNEIPFFRDVTQPWYCPCDKTGVSSKRLRPYCALYEPVHVFNQRRHLGKETLKWHVLDCLTCVKISNSRVRPGGSEDTGESRIGRVLYAAFYRPLS